MRTETFHTSGGLQLSVEIPTGLVEVIGADGDETVLQIDGERNPDDVAVRLEPRAGGHRLRIEHRGRRFGLLGSGDLHVRATVPEDTDVELSTGSADLTVRGEVRSITLRAGSGDLAFDRASGDVTVKVASGDVLGTHVGGDLTMHGASGDLSIAHVEGDVTARTASGDVGIGHVTGSVRASTVAGEIRIDALSAGSAEIRTVSGDVEVCVERGTGVLLDLSTTSGEVTSELEMGDGDGRSPDLELRIGSVSGDVIVRRARRRRDDGGGSTG
jgi:DUF4097 and DUF4098 domain-containing protein YvlB